MESLGVNETWISNAWDNSQNGSEPGQGEFLVVFFDLSNVMLTTFEFLWTFCSLFTNGCVLLALWKIPDKDKFKSRTLLMNSIIADTSYQISNFITGGIYIAIGLGLDKTTYQSCYLGFKIFFVTLFQYIQSLASAFLALDRVYAIVAPMSYYMKGYSKGTIGIIVLIIWGVSLILVSSFFVPTKYEWERYCKILNLNQENWADKARYPLQISLYFFVLCVYVALFAKLKFQRSDLTKSNSPQSVQSVRLIVTFFALHLSTFLLFLPGPTYGTLVTAGVVKPSSYARLFASNILVQLYSLNCIVNPIIIMTKVPAVKAYIMSIWKGQNKPTISSTHSKETKS